ncbi:hypothetical protein CU097_008769 [Rhizopus azygosporus]|uniref:Uncharacterized protein n=1 Tax=Rhizopus azygosporus TaxID=86630 RepID=A0A367K5W7_RHIAZ|nr:hypothetical protein CU097_008769 [Rhizopus azygosporus]
MTAFEDTVKPTREEQEQGDLNDITSLSVLLLKCTSWVTRNLKNAKKPKRP